MSESGVIKMEVFRTLIEKDETNPINLGEKLGLFYTGEHSADYGFPCDVKIPVDEENIAKFVAPKNSLLVLPVYGLVNSEMRISLTKFSNECNSNQIGYYVVSKNQAQLWLGQDCSNDEILHKVNWEIRETDSVLRGEVYKVILERRIDGEDWQTIESVGGIIGYDQAEAESAQMLRYKQVAE